MSKDPNLRISSKLLNMKFMKAETIDSRAKSLIDGDNWVIETNFNEEGNRNKHKMDLNSDNFNMHYKPKELVKKLYSSARRTSGKLLGQKRAQAEAEKKIENDDDKIHNYQKLKSKKKPNNYKK